MSAKVSTKVSPKAEPGNAKLLQQFAAAQRVSTPLVIVNTPDQAATIATLRSVINEAVPVYSWDCIDGIIALNTPGKAGLKSVDTSESYDVGKAIVALPDLPAGTHTAKDGDIPGSVLFFKNAQMYLKEGEPQWRVVRQGVYNLRDCFAADAKMLVLLGPSVPVPVELQGSVLVLDEPLPDEFSLEGVADDIAKAGKLTLTTEDKQKAVGAMLGLCTFEASQATAMAVQFLSGKPSHIDIPALLARKEQSINETRGLKVQHGNSSFGLIGGLEHIKDYCRDIIGGVEAPRLIVRLDEVEKALAGSNGDSSGVSQDQFGYLLSSMEDNGWGGLIAVGFPGTGKSEISKAMGNLAGTLTISMDLGDMLGSLVGQSQEMVRAAVKVLKAIGGENVMFVATSNDTSRLKSEFIRRFYYQEWFFDLPEDSAKASIWDIYRAKYGLDEQTIPDDTGWTGSEIKTACLMAHRLKRPITEAAKNIVPFALSNKDLVESLRAQAHNRYLCATHGGPYLPPDIRNPKAETTKPRRTFNN